MTPDPPTRLASIEAKVKSARLDWALQSDEEPDLLVDLAYVLDLLVAQQTARVQELEREDERARNAEADFARHINRLIAALRIHGDHLKSCRKYNDPTYGMTAYPYPDVPCDCGFDEALGVEKRPIDD